MTAAIRVEGLGKRYRLNRSAERSGYRTLRESLVDAVSAPFRRNKGSTSEDFWALDDISFEVQPGEVVGIIGRNGAGKSTLLKILSRITKPTKGRVEINGRVGSLLEVGTGFHPELSGRENIYLNGSILGMSRREIDRKFDEIVAFAEVEKFLDTPVKRYSSGMYVRLAFAVAAHLEPEILIVDEVLAVGDAQFQKKCLDKMGEVAKGGRAVLLVSHNMAAIHQLTDRCVYLRVGRVACVERTPSVTDRYLEDSSAAKRQHPESLDYYRRESTSESSIRFRRVRFLTERGQDADSLRTGDTFRVEATVEAAQAHEHACLTFWLSNERGERVSTFFSGDTQFSFPISHGAQRIACEVIGLPLSPGRYTATIGINRTANTVAFDVLVDYPAFEVRLPDVESGALDFAHRQWGCVHWTQVAWERSCSP